MPAQRVTVVKIGGRAADLIGCQLREWSTERQPPKDKWSSVDWPLPVRDRADDLAERLRAHSTTLPVIHFVEWTDPWSMGNLFEHWLTPPDGPPPYFIEARQFQLFGYELPDGGRLAKHLANAGRQQWSESDWYITRLREALGAWEKLVERAVLVVLRHVIGPLVSDEEIVESMSTVPLWLSEDRASST